MSVGTPPLVSIITTSYNYGQYIDKTIRSVLDQTYQHWELIISDDYSTDSSLAVIRSFKDPRITLIMAEKNEGAAAAYRKALALCRGMYLMSLDSDDYLSLDQINRQVLMLEQHPEIDILGTFIYEIDSFGTLVTEGLQANWFNRVIDLNNLTEWVEQNHLCHSSVLMRRVVHDLIGSFNDDLVYTPDYEFWVRCLLAGKHFAVIPEPMTYYRVHSKNISLNNAQNEKPLLERLYIFCNYIKPFLFQRNQFDLIAQTILGLWDITTGFRLSQQRELGIIAVLLTSRVNSSFPAFVEQIDAELPVCQQEHCILVRAVLSRFLDQQQWSRELQNGNTWLSGQIESWQAEVVRQQIASHEQQIWSKELEGGKQWLEAQYQAWMHETRSIQGLYNELQNSYSQLQEAHHQLQEAHYQLQEVHHQLQEAYEFESNRLLKDRILDRVRAILR